MASNTEHSETPVAANAMPAPTWHRLKVSDAEVRLPMGQPIESDVSLELVGIELTDCDDVSPTLFDAALAAYQQEIDSESHQAAPRAVEIAAQQEEEVGNLDLPALSTYQRKAVLQDIAGNVSDAFVTGMGEEAYSFLLAAAGGRTALSAPSNSECSAIVRIAAVEGSSSAACVDVVAEAGSSLNLVVSYEGDAKQGFVGCGLRVFAAAGSQVNIQSIQSLTGNITVFDDSGFVLGSNAHVAVGHRVLGAEDAFTGLAADLRGEGSRIDVQTRYIASGSQSRDFNYSVKQRGRSTESNLDANGVLAGASKKVLRGTIDFVYGCKGSTGNERETVLLADDRVQNKTVPVILCDEDDVMGNHGATIGHVRPEQRFYLNCRGLSDSAIESLFSVAALEEACMAFPDDQIRRQVLHLAEQHGIDPVEFFTADSEEA